MAVQGNGTTMRSSEMARSYTGPTWMKISACLDSWLGVDQGKVKNRSKSGSKGAPYLASSKATLNLPTLTRLGRIRLPQPFDKLSRHSPTNPHQACCLYLQIQVQYSTVDNDWNGIPLSVIHMEKDL